MSEPLFALLLPTALFGPAALIAAMVLLVREVVPALSALARGRIRMKGHGRRMVERKSEPERFRSMVMRRLTVGGAGFLFCLGMGVILILRNVPFNQLIG